LQSYNKHQIYQHQDAIPKVRLQVCPRILPLLCPPYLRPKLTRPLSTKHSGTLRTVEDDRSYMLALSKDRERSAKWQRASELLLAAADVGAFSKQFELALYYDGRLILRPH